MRISSTAFLLLLLGLINPVHLSFSDLLGDLEGSGYDLDISGSGDWSEQGGTKNVKDHSNNKDGRIFASDAGGGINNAPHGSSVLTVDNKQRPAIDSGAGFIVVTNTKSFLEREEIFAGVIAGGVTGLLIASALAGILIYRWQKKDEEGYILGQQTASGEDCHKTEREEVV